MIKLAQPFLLSFFLFFTVSTRAQPGWQDYTIRYYYSILDDKGREIEFRKNRHYSIMIDSVLYQKSTIPQEILTPATPYSRGFDFHIRINDFSVAVPDANFRNREKNLEIKIIYKSDTMHLCQPTGTTSIDMTGKNAASKADLTLRFLAGHYYFPPWTQSLMNSLPITSKNVRFKNTDQSNFLVSEQVYQSVLYKQDDQRTMLTYNERVVNNFMKGHFSISVRAEPTRFNMSPGPYKYPRWDRVLHPSKDKNRYYGMIEYNMSGSGCHSYKKVFSVLNKQTNSIEQWFPKENFRLFGCSKLYADTFNGSIYLPVRIKERVSPGSTDCNDKNPVNTFVYRSDDEGRTWQKDLLLSQLFNRYYIRYFEFIDGQHCIAYRREKVPLMGKKYKISQGTYYLLRNKHIIDSLKSPDDLHYNDNYNRYGFSLNKDSASLGGWGYVKYRPDSSAYFQPYLKKQGAKWNFKVAEKVFIRPKNPLPKSPDSIKKFKNFDLLNGRELVFKNGTGRLLLNQDANDQLSYRGYKILEKNSHIYIISRSFAYASFDEGKSWYVYPQPLVSGNYQHHFLEIDNQYQISHFSNDRKEGMKQVFHVFIKSNQLH